MFLYPSLHARLGNRSVYFNRGMPSSTFRYVELPNVFCQTYGIYILRLMDTAIYKQKTFR